MENIPESPKMELERETLDHLSTARKWSMFLARLGFVFLLLVILLGIFTGAFLSFFNSGAEAIGLPGLVLIVLLFILGVFYILPVYHLFFFSKHMQAAIKSDNKSELRKAFRSLKSYFVYLGVLTILIITMYIIIIGVGSALMAFLKIL